MFAAYEGAASESPLSYREATQLSGDATIQISRVRIVDAIRGEKPWKVCLYHRGVAHPRSLALRFSRQCLLLASLHRSLHCGREFLAAKRLGEKDGTGRYLIRAWVATH